MHKTVKGYLFVIISAVVYGCMPLGAKIIYAEGVNSMSLVLYRNLLSIPVMAALVKLQGDTLRITGKEAVKISALSMLGACITPLLIYNAYHYVSSGAVTTMHFIYPAVVVLGGMLFLKEKAPISSLICVGLCTLGVCLFYSPSEVMDPFGCALALFSGVTYAAYILLLPRSGLKTMSGFKLSMYMSLVCSMVLFPVCLFSGSLTAPVSLKGWIACLLFSLALCMGAVYLFQQGAFLIGSQRAAILSTFEPITSLVVGVAFLQERLSSHAVFGAVLIVTASIGISMSDLIRAREKHHHPHTK